MIELVLLIGFVVPLALWQFYDLDKAKKETARKRQEALSKEVNKVESAGESVSTPGD
jgi:hypothetical protein